MTTERLIYISTFDYPPRYAHAVHALLMARAFYKKFGKNFLFFVNTVADQTLANIPHRLLFGPLGRRIKLWGLRRLLIPLPLLWFFITHSSWRGSTTTLFTNDPGLIPMLAFLKKRFGCSCIFESHGTLTSEQELTLATICERTIFLTPFLEREALARTPELREQALVVGNATDVAAFEKIAGDAATLRRTLSLPDEFTIGYIGRFEPLGEDKGLKFLISAIGHIAEARLLLVGGSRDEIAKYRDYIVKDKMEDKVSLVPHVAPHLVATYIKACDILAYVPPGQSVFFQKETSPMKLFEYMAARRPMIVSDLPTSHTIVSPDEAYFIPPGDEAAFCEAVRAIRAYPVEAHMRTERAFTRVAHNTWEARVEKILA